MDHTAVLDFSFIVSLADEERGDVTVGHTFDPCRLAYLAYTLND
jgi:hypothetical protein